MATPDHDRPYRDLGFLLFGLGIVALGVAGMATGTTIICPGSNHGEPWRVGAPGARVAAAGMMLVGSGCLGSWWWQQRRNWPIYLFLAGVVLVALGQLMAWLARLI